MNITYQEEPNLSVDAFRDILMSCSLGTRRPIREPDRLEQMLKQADLIITARNGEQLVGVARALSDFTYCTYLSDLAVHDAYQRLGIGKELIRQTKLATGLAKLVLISAPQAVDYYPKIGMQHHAHCYFLENEQELI
ncbi:GNAT family N-acetyltransferase [Pararhodonellum marinum]|uniref:GNAT family N-acetyltransferase n=1 Tax=Pararhodonellum marinum TaxID=2755358 RepID=UPI00188DCF9A|nr:GNAT family N-acetyltransferase [Pararhodonellum marinum]